VGLTNGVAYSFTVKALNGAGWGPASELSAPVTPGAPQVVQIVLDQGKRTRDCRTDCKGDRHDRLTTKGTTVGIKPGTQLVPYLRYSGQSGFTRKKATITVQSDGSFRWTTGQIRSSKGVTAYMAWRDVKSNRVFWAKVR
jgi:hypothetical protein